MNLNTTTGDMQSLVIQTADNAGTLKLMLLAEITQNYQLTFAICMIVNVMHALCTATVKCM